MGFRNLFEGINDSLVEIDGEKCENCKNKKEEGIAAGIKLTGRALLDLEDLVVAYDKGDEKEILKSAEKLDNDINIETLQMALTEVDFQKELRRFIAHMKGENMKTIGDFVDSLKKNECITEKKITRNYINPVVGGTEGTDAGAEGVGEGVSLGIIDGLKNLVSEDKKCKGKKCNEGFEDIVKKVTEAVKKIVDNCDINFDTKTSTLTVKFNNNEPIKESIDSVSIKDIDDFVNEAKKKFPGSEAIYDGDKHVITITLDDVVEEDLSDTLHDIKTDIAAHAVTSAIMGAL